MEGRWREGERGRERERERKRERDRERDQTDPLILFISVEAK